MGIDIDIGNTFKISVTVGIGLSAKFLRPLSASNIADTFYKYRQQARSFVKHFFNWSLMQLSPMTIDNISRVCFF